MLDSDPGSKPAASQDGLAVRLARELAVLGGLILIGIAVLTVVSIIGRNFLSAAVPGDYELVEYGAGVAAALFLPLAQIKLVHPRIAFLSELLGAPVRCFMDGLALCLGAGLSLLLAVQLAWGAWDAMRFGDQSMILSLPNWIGIGILALCLGLSGLLALYCFVRRAPGPA